MHFLNEKFFIWIQISLEFVPKGPIDNKSAWVQVMAWRRTGDKPLSEPMLNQFTDAYMRHQREISYYTALGCIVEAHNLQFYEWDD